MSKLSSNLNSNLNNSKYLVDLKTLVHSSPYSWNLKHNIVDKDNLVDNEYIVSTKYGIFFNDTDKSNKRFKKNVERTLDADKVAVEKELRQHYKNVFFPFCVSMNATPVIDFKKVSFKIEDFKNSKYSNLLEKLDNLFKKYENTGYFDSDKPFYIKDENISFCVKKEITKDTDTSILASFVEDFYENIKGFKIGFYLKKGVNYEIN